MMNEITLREYILTLIAICGEFPASQLERLEGGERYKQELIKKLKKLKWIHTFYKEGLRGYRLRLTAKEMLLRDNPERFSFYLTGESETNHIRSEYTRRLRLHRTAEAWITMLNADVSIFRDEKTNIFSPEWSETDVIPPAFYSSIEIKEMGRYMTKISSSRAIGVLLTEKTVYATYSLGDSLMKWAYKAEMRFRMMMVNVLCQERLPDRYSRDNICGLLLANSMELVGEIFRQSRNSSYFLLEEGYEHFYFVTNDHKGERGLSLLCDGELKSTLDEMMMDGLSPRNPTMAIENDAFDENGDPVLFGYTCDLPRLKRFDTAIGNSETKGTVICFDFQKDVLAGVMSDKVRFQAINFEKWEEAFFEME